MVNSKYSVYRPSYIIYLVLSLAIIVLALYLIKKYVKKEKTLDKTILILAGVWLLLGIGNRIAECCDYILKYHIEGFTWKYLLPYTFCSLTSIVTPIIILISKGKSNALHCFIYFGLLGSVITYAYPDWLADYPMYDASSIFGLLHHTMMLFVCLLLLITKRFVPDAKKFFIMPLGYMISVIYGLFLVTVLKFENAICIVKPLMSGSKFIEVVSSWYGILIVGSIILIIFLFIYERITKKVTVKDFFLEILRINK